MQARAAPLALPRRRAAVQMSAGSSAVAPSPTKSVMSKIGKVAVAMMTIFFLMLGAPMDADAASRSKGGRSGGRMGGGFRAKPPAQTKTIPSSTTSTAPAGAAAATATAATPAAAGAAAAAPGTTVVHHHHHGGAVGGGGFRAGLGMGIGAGLTSPFGFSPFGGFGMMSPFGGFGMMGFRPFMPLTSIITAVFLIGAVSMAWVFLAASGGGRRGRRD